MSHSPVTRQPHCRHKDFARSPHPVHLKSFTLFSQLTPYNRFAVTNSPGACVPRLPRLRHKNSVRGPHPAHPKSLTILSRLTSYSGFCVTNSPGACVPRPPANDVISIINTQPHLHLLNLWDTLGFQSAMPARFTSRNRSLNPSGIPVGIINILVIVSGPA
jgi:hypothetical protein